MLIHGLYLLHMPVAAGVRFQRLLVRLSTIKLLCLAFFAILVNYYWLHIINKFSFQRMNLNNLSLIAYPT